MITKKQAKKYFDKLELNSLDKRTNFDFIKFQEIDGKIVNSVESDNIEVEDLTQVDSKEIEKYYGKLIGYTNKIDAFNYTNWKFGILIRIKKGESATIISENIGKGNIATRTLIIAEKGSKAKIIEKTTGDITFRSEAVEIFLEEDAKVEYINYQNIPQDSQNLTTKKANLKKNSELKWIDLCFGGKLTISEMTNLLEEQGSSSKTLGLYYGEGKQHFDLAVGSIHVAPDTTSEMITKGALKDKAKCVYRGLIHIKEKAARSNGFQKEDTLMLSEGAEVDPIPRLDIENNDVKCAHGAAITQIDKDKLFYMTSRGIDELTAKKMAVEGFFDTFITEINNEELETELKNIVKQRTK